MTRRVVITGTGALSALGATPDELWTGLLAGRSGVRRIERFVRAGLRVTTGGDVGAIAHDRADRDLEIARAAIDAAVVEAGIDTAASGLCWANSLDTFQITADGPIMRSAGTCFSATAARFGRPRRMFAVACASGTFAIGEAFTLVRSGRVDTCVAGGSSVMLTPFYLTGFAGLGAVALDREDDDPSAACRPFDRNRRGFALADGAGAVVVESLDSARRRGAAVLAEIVGFGTSADAFDLNRPPDDGAGALACMGRALDDAGLDPDAIDAVNAHGTGTVVGDLAEAAALRALLGDRAMRTPVSSAKGAIGHAMAAAGALEAIVAARTCATGIVPPTVSLQKPDEKCALDHVVRHPRACDAHRVLSASFGMGGQNAALVLQRVQS